MIDRTIEADLALRPHVFLGEGHEINERRTWVVIWLCGATMVAEIVGGMLFGSIALVADGLHMSTHAGALLLAAVAYRYARHHANDARFTFGTGKLGDLAGFTNAIILAMIALLIAYEAISRFIAPVPIRFNEAIPVALLGLAVNVVSVLLLSGGGAHSHHGHSHGHGGDSHIHDDVRRMEMDEGSFELQIFEREGIPPRFRLRFDRSTIARADDVLLETERPEGRRQTFALADRGSYLESVDEIPEPHAFNVSLRVQGSAQLYSIAFEDHDHAHGSAHRDHNMRAALIHILSDIAVSVLVLIGLLLGRFLGWVWMDPVAGACGAAVIAVWSYGLARDTGAILLDMNPDRAMAQRMRDTIEGDGDCLTDLHLWRLGPGHLGAIVSVSTSKQRDSRYYRRLLDRFRSLSHVTVEVESR